MFTRYSSKCNVILYQGIFLPVNGSEEMERMTNISHSMKFLPIDHVDGNFCLPVIPHYVMSFLCQGVSPPVTGCDETTSPIVVETDREMTTYTLVLIVVALVLVISWCNSFHVLCVQYIFVGMQGFGNKQMKALSSQSRF